MTDANPHNLSIADLHANVRVWNAFAAKHARLARHARHPGSRLYHEERRLACLAHADRYRRLIAAAR